MSANQNLSFREDTPLRNRHSYTMSIQAQITIAAACGEKVGHRDVQVAWLLEVVYLVTVHYQINLCIDIWTVEERSLQDLVDWRKDSTLENFINWALWLFASAAIGEGDTVGMKDEGAAIVKDQFLEPVFRENGHWKCFPWWISIWYPTMDRYEGGATVENMSSFILIYIFNYVYCESMCCNGSRVITSVVSVS